MEIHEVIVKFVKNIEFEVLMAVTMNNIVFWDLTPYSLLDNNLLIFWRNILLPS
jgi:hypothetical protein